MRLTGQEGEPCPGWWVHWELIDTGRGVLGCLDKYVSKTDRDGYAWNLYFGPDDGAAGTCKLRTYVALN